MAVLFYILGFIGILVLLLLLIGLFLQRNYSINKSIVINKPLAEVFEFIKHLKNQEQYSKWVMMDPNLRKSFKGTDGTVGFIYAWEGNKKAGKGEQEIKNIVDGKQIDIEVRFKEPFESVANTPFIFESVAPNQTKVSWSMTSEMKYPMNLMLLFGLHKVLAKDLEISLNNLKLRLER